jgi:Flp pilus assembly protein TadG
MFEPNARIDRNPVVDMSAVSRAVSSRTVRLLAGCGFRSHREGERGAALIELALTVPILMIIVLGMCGFAFVFNQYLELTEATNVAAEWVSYSRGQKNLDVCAVAYTNATKMSPALTASKMKFTVTANSVTGVTAASGSANVTCATTAMQSAMSTGLGFPATVTIQYPVAAPFTLNLGFYSFNPMPGFTMQAQITETIQ